MITVPALAAIPAIRHGFFTRRGGVSEGPYASLNCGFGPEDAASNVMTNRARAATRLGAGPDTLLTARQTHGSRVSEVRAPFAPADAPVADALVTSVPGIALGVLTADCAPVLIADGEAGVIGVAHAGWRGALAGVVEKAVAGMERLGAGRARIVAAIGPCIGKASYEVGPEFFHVFVEDDARNGDFFARAPFPDRLLFDLAGYLRRRLSRLGLAGVYDIGEDTFVEEERFFSYRRSRLRGEVACGRALSAILLESRAEFAESEDG